MKKSKTKEEDVDKVFKKFDQQWSAVLETLTRWSNKHSKPKNIEDIEVSNDTVN